MLARLISKFYFWWELLRRSSAQAITYIKYAQAFCSVCSLHFAAISEFGSKSMKLSVFIMCVTTISGCSGVMRAQPKVDCSVGIGANCKSMSEVNQMVNLGEIAGDKGQIKGEKLSLNINGDVQDSVADVERLPEQTMRIWMNSFTDEKDDYVKETYVYTVVEPGKWLSNILR